MTRALMVQGTASGVGKSWVATGLCALLARRGLRVAPFKAWNMSNNAAPARLSHDGADGWGEIGRAQAAQARAAGLEPHVDMNPLLLKPMAGGTDVVVRGRSRGAMSIAAYQAAREELWAEVTAAYARVAAGVDVVVIEGAGSPAEINLRGDMANMEMARHAGAAVLLVGDIDRGGVFASLYGTVGLLSPEDRARVAGLVVNRFRGDPAAMVPAMAPLAALAGVPVRGVLPWRDDIHVDDEDAAVLRAGVGAVDVCALAFPSVSNTTDLARLGREPGVGVRWAARAGEVGNPDLLVLPGSRDTEADMRWMRARGLDRVVRAAAARGIPVLGLCGGYQMLGARLGGEAGLGMLPVATDYAEGKVVRPVRGRTAGGWLLPAGLPVEGYEIHAGRTVGAAPLVWVDRATGARMVEPQAQGAPRRGAAPDGAVAMALREAAPLPEAAALPEAAPLPEAAALPEAAPDGAVVGLVAGTYVHGLLDAPEVRAALVAALRERKGLDPAAVVEGVRGFDTLADVMEAHLDLRGLV